MTESALLGPFYAEGSVPVQRGADIALSDEGERLIVRGRDITVQRQTMADTVHQITLTSPTGAARTMDLQAVEPGLWRAATTANELGLWRATDGKLTALANVGPANPREFAEVTSTTDVLQALSRATGDPVSSESAP